MALVAPPRPSGPETELERLEPALEPDGRAELLLPPRDEAEPVRLLDDVGVREPEGTCTEAGGRDSPAEPEDPDEDEPEEPDPVVRGIACGADSPDPDELPEDVDGRGTAWALAMAGTAKASATPAATNE